MKTLITTTHLPRLIKAAVIGANTVPRGDRSVNTTTPRALRSISSLSLVWAAALVALVAIASQTALADQPPATRTAKVPLAGLDLSTSAGARAAYERIKSTAERLCFQMRDPSLSDNEVTYSDCVHQALEASIHRIKAPMLAALEK
jgi:UrcA family protein